MSINKSLTLVFLFQAKNQIIDILFEGIWLVCYSQNQVISLIAQNCAVPLIYILTRELPCTVHNRNYHMHFIKLKDGK